MRFEYEKHFSYERDKENDRLLNFVNRTVFKNEEYLFFERVGEKQHCHCTYCGENFLSINLSHNEKVTCERCGEELTAKNAKFGRKNAKNEAVFYYFDKSLIDPEMIVGKGFYVSKDYSVSYRNPKLDLKLKALYFFKHGEPSRMYIDYYYGASKTATIYDFNINGLARYKAYTDFESLERAIKGTIFDNINYEIPVVSLVKLLDEYSKYTWVEQLLKMGFTSFVASRVNKEKNYNCINYRGKDIFKKLRLTRDKVKELQKYGADRITPDILKLYQIQAKDNSKLTIYDVVDIASTFAYHVEDLIYISKYTKLRKIIKYIKKQTELERHDEESGKVLREYGPRELIGFYRDYIENCLKLEFDIKSERVLFPRDIKKSHDDLIKQVSVKGDMRLNKKMKKRAIGINKKWAYKYKNIFIRAAETTEELIEEGKKLGHCVATNYTNKYALGKTNILFIRKVSAPDTPYYTVEINNSGELIQVRSKKNHTPKENNDIEVMEFVEEFKKEILNKKKKNSSNVA